MGVLLKEINEAGNLSLSLVSNRMLLVVAREEVQSGKTLDFDSRHVDLISRRIHLGDNELIMRLGNLIR